MVRKKIKQDAKKHSNPGPLVGEDVPTRTLAMFRKWICIRTKHQRT